MKNDFIWTFKTSELASGLGGKFSLEYHIPQSKLKVSPKELVGSRIWLVVKHEGKSYLYAFLNPATIEIYHEGRYKNDFLLQCEPLSSVRLLPRVESTDPWMLDFSHDEGIRRCDNTEQAVLLTMVSKNHRTGFSVPSSSILKSVPKTESTSLEDVVRDQFMNLIRTVSFGDLSRFRALPDKISALGGAVLTILESTHPHLDQKSIVNLISELDPISHGDISNVLKSQDSISNTLISLPPTVDTFLEEIDPDRISPRSFVARSSTSSLEWIDGLNDAEQVHEKILKDIVLRLQEKGFTTYKTRSFDLFSEKENVKILWEIKSAKGQNTVSQGEKGVVQLLKYIIALRRNNSDELSYILLIQDTGQQAIMQYLSDMADYVGVNLVLYDDQKEWPQRISQVSTEAQSNKTTILNYL